MHTDRSWCSFSPSMWTEKVRYLLGWNRCIFCFSSSALVHRYTYFLRATRPRTISRRDGRANRIQRDLVAAFQAYRQIVVLLLAIHVDRKGEVLARLEQVHLLLQQQMHLFQPSK